jgi:tRNA(fMet)-specific endonuclease VapC
MIFLDTDHISVLQYEGSPHAVALQARLEVLPPDEVATTVITVEEQMRGWLGLIHRYTDVHRQVEYYERLIGLIDFFAAWHILPFDQQAANTFQRLRRQRVHMGAMDLRIAAVL